VYREERDVDDRLLMRAIRAGDGEALEHLYERYRTLVYTRGLRILGNHELAEDLVQNVFWRVWQHSASFCSERGHVAQWVFGITKYACIDELRRARVHPTVVYEDLIHDHVSMHDAYDGLAVIWAAEQQQSIAAALQHIPALQRQVVLLSYIEGLSCQQIASQLDQPLGTIKTRIRLGLRKLRHLLVALAPSANEI
jgi:RNA polymerase sigma-70 factor (ECF subfamily)